MKEICKWVMVGVVIIVLFWAGVQASKQLEAVILERNRLILELETLTEEQVELERRLTELQKQKDDLIRSIQERDSLERRLEEFLERFEVSTMEATAYTLSCGNGDGLTSIGRIPKVGKTIAVDPRVIPYGSRVWIDGEGPYVAEDTGFLIKGDRIDIYMGEGQEAYRTAMRWGRQEVQIIFERGEEL